MKLYKALAVIVLLLNFQRNSAQGEAIKSIDSLANLLSNKNCFNGDILVSVDGKPIYEKSIGYRDIVLKEKIQRNSIFNIGSISKPFTAVAVLQLQQKGMLNIEDNVLKYIPEFPYNNICIKHLLSHTSGLKQNLGQFEELDLEKPINNDSIIAILTKYKPDLFAAPGSEWIYSNIGYEVLALIVERVSKMKFSNYADQYIFKPSGMKRTFIPSSQRITEWLPKGITEKDLLVPHEYKNLSACEVAPVDTINFVQQRKNFTVGSENVYSCVGDLSKFDKALREHKILSASLQELAYTPFVLANGDTAKDLNASIPSYFGLGWFISIDQNKGKIIWHKGRSFGSRSVFLRNPKKKTVVAVTDNFDYPAVDLKGIAFLKTLNNEPYRNPVLMSLVQKLGCESGAMGVEIALSRFENRKNNERQNYYISEEEIIQLSQLLASNNKASDAKSILMYSEKIFPKSPSVCSEYAKLMLREEKKDIAGIYYKKAVELSGETPAEKESYLNGTGYYFLSSGNYNFAEFVLKLNTELFPNSGNVYDSYASALEKNNKLDLAVAIEEKAVAIATINNDLLLETFKENLKKLKQRAATNRR